MVYSISRDTYKGLKLNLHSDTSWINYQYIIQILYTQFSLANIVDTFEVSEM